MAARSMRIDFQDEFGDDLEEALTYYDRWFSRPQIETLADIADVDLETESIEEDCRKLYEEGVLQDFHRYVAALDGIGPSTIIEGIRAINRDKMEGLSDADMHDKSALLLHIYSWEWGEDKLELIQALKNFKNKRTYQREEISGEKSFDEITADEIDLLERTLTQSIKEANSRRKYKARLKSVNLIDDNDLVVEIDVEYKSGHYRQFKFREDEALDYEREGGRDINVQQYWPIATRYVHVNYAEDEFDHDIQRSEEDFINPVLTTLYDDVEYGDHVHFVDPADYPDKTPAEFVEERIEDEKDRIDDSDTLDDDEKEEYKDILDDLSTAEQTALILENINVVGDPSRIEIQTDEPLQSFAEGNNLETQLDRFNERSQRREYTLRLGDREIQVRGVKITIFGDISKEEEEMITRILREDSASA